MSGNAIAPLLLTPPAAWPTGQGAASGRGPVRSLSGMARRQWRIASAIAAVGFVVSLGLGILLPKRYIAEAAITIPVGQRDNGQGGAGPSDPTSDEAILLTELQILRSDWLVRRAVQTVEQDGDEGIGRDGDWQSVAGRVLLWAETAVGAAPRAPTASAAVLLQQSVVRVSERLAVERDPGTRIIHVRFWSHDPQRALHFVDTLVGEYQRAQVDAKVAAAHDLERTLAAPLAELRENALKSEQQVDDFRRSAGLMDGNDGSLAAKQIAALSDLLIQVRARRQESEARVLALESGRGIDAIPEAINDQLITRLRQEQALLSQNLLVLRGQLDDGNPRVIEARGKLDDVERRIDDEVRRVAVSLRRDVAIQQRREVEIQGDIESKRGEYDRLNAAQVRMRELAREAEANRILVTAFLERHKQIQVQGIVAQPSALVLSWPILPAVPAFPNLKSLLPFSLGFAVLAGFAVGALRELRRPGIIGLEELEAFPSPAAGIIPATPAHLGVPEDLVVTNPGSAYVEAVRKLVAATVLAGGDAPRSLLVTSCLPREGKTTTALALARAAAYGGRRVVAVDCDLRNPGLSRSLAEPPGPGLAEILAGRIPLAEAVRRDRFNRLDVITAGRGSLFDLPDRAALEDLLLELKQRYDLVVLDGPPSAVVADTRILAGLADATLFVVEWASTPAALAQNEMATLLADGRMAGMVLNRVDFGQLTPYGRRLAEFYPPYQEAPRR